MTRHNYPMTHRLQLALTYIEDHLTESLSLADLAASAHLSSYHFARLFRAMFGRAPMEYVRARRLTEAVLTLRRNPQSSITELAHRYGFASHQGFTSAFKRQFHIAPARYRGQQFALPIQEAIVMSNHQPVIPAPPVYQQLDSLRVVGLAMECTPENRVEIPQLWGRFAPSIGTIPGQQGFTTYGVCLPRGDGNFGYVASVATSAASPVPDGMVAVDIPAGRYAVFTHKGSLDFLSDTVDYIFGTWAEETGELQVGAPDFERYDDRFNPETATGEMEYWVPVESA